MMNLLIILMCVGNFGISTILFLVQQKLFKACEVNNDNIQTVNKFCQILNDLYISVVKNKDNDTTKESVQDGE